MAELTDTFRVTIDSKISSNIHTSGQWNPHKFKKYNKRIYYYDTSQPLCNLQTKPIDQ